LPGGAVFKLRTIVEEIHETELIGEVIFNKDDKGVRHLFWVNETGEKRAIPDEDTASLFVTQRGFIGVGKDRFTSINSGQDLPPITEECFRRTEQNNMFVILDGRIFYLSSLTLVMKHGWLNRLSEIPLITPDDFQGNRIHR